MYSSTRYFAISFCNPLFCALNPLIRFSFTFLAYSQLIDQNLKAQDLKQTFVEESNLKANLLTLYVIDPEVDDYIVQDMLNVDDISHMTGERNISSLYKVTPL